MICDVDDCGAPVGFDYVICNYTCPIHGERAAEDVFEFNNTERLVWLRSRTVSYSAEIRKSRLKANKTVDGMPGFVWEKWP